MARYKHLSARMNLKPVSSPLALVAARVLLVSALLNWPYLLADERADVDESIRRAVQYLKVEVPKWQRENHCASCHHQGDASRALIAAESAGFLDATESLATTVTWLENPSQWKNNKGLKEASDPRLSTLQFTFTLFDVRTPRIPRMDGALAEAAELLTALQQPGGAWEIDGVGQFASPLTHGPILLTGKATRVLKSIAPERYRKQIARAETWLLDQAPRNTLESSSLVIACHELALEHSQLARCQSTILDSQSDKGGLGPYSSAADEIFDTALALLATTKLQKSESIAKFQSRAINYLRSMQHQSGHWSETTRPSGTESYAHRVSTTAWVTQALLAARRQLPSE